MSLLKDSVLEIRGFFRATSGEPSSARMAAFPISELVVLRNLKLSLGRRVLIEGLLFDEEGPWEGSFILYKLGLGRGEKFTLLGVGVFGGMSMLRNSCLASSRVLVGISKLRFCLLPCCPPLLGCSSVISFDFTLYT